MIGEIGNQVADITRTQGKIAEEKALKDPKAIQAAKEVLAEKAEAAAANAAKNAGKGSTDSLSGQPTKLPANASAENIRSLQRENEGQRSRLKMVIMLSRIL